MIISLFLFLIVGGVLYLMLSDTMVVKKILCKLFGHQTNGNRFDGSEYMSCGNIVIDGIGRMHMDIETECARCEKYFRVGRIHIPFGKIKDASKYEMPSEIRKWIDDILDEQWDKAQKIVDEGKYNE